MQVFIVRTARTTETGGKELSPRGREQAEHVGRWVAERIALESADTARPAALAAVAGVGAPADWVMSGPESPTAETSRIVATTARASATTRTELAGSCDVRGVIAMMAAHSGKRAGPGGAGSALVLVCSSAGVTELIGALLSPEHASALLLRAGEALELEVRLAQPIGTARVVARGYLDERKTARPAQRVAA